MMVKIISDSTCDLSKELILKYDIEIVPLHILMGEEEFEDSVNITPDEIYAWSDKNKTTPKTSAVSIDKLQEVYRKYVDMGMEIVCFSISAEMSVTGNVMRMAAEEEGVQDKVFVIDSRNLSTGVGLQVLRAASLAMEGKSAVEIVAEIKDMSPRVRASFVVDILTYLYRGGRCSGLTALAGGVLKLHPKIVVEDGKMHPDKKYRGKIDGAILNYVKDMEGELKSADKERVFITHSGCDEETIKMVREYLEQLEVFNEIHVTRAGGVISSHCGPGTLGVLFVEGKN